MAAVAPTQTRTMRELLDDVERYVWSFPEVEVLRADRLWIEEEEENTRRSSATARDHPRTARLNQFIHEIVAEELERIDDERLRTVHDRGGRGRRRPAARRSGTRRSTGWPVARPMPRRDGHDNDGRLADALGTGPASSRPSPARPTSGARPSCRSSPIW